MKVLQINLRRLRLFGCSLKLLANVQCTSTRKRGVQLIPARYFTYLKERKCLKSLQSSFCILPQPAFYSQSAVCILLSVCILPLVRSLQSAVCSLRCTLTTKRIKLTEFKFHTNLALSLPRFEQPGHGPSG